MIKKSLVYVGALCLLIVPGFAFATNDQSSVTTASISNTSSMSNYSEEELVALIAKLQKQLEQVRQNKVQCILADVDLSLGDGEDGVSQANVKNLQNLLKEKGYFVHNPTGYFGKLTRTALINFQKASGLDQTGELNASSRAYVKSLKCKKVYSVSAVKNVEMKDKDVVKNSASVSAITVASDGSKVKWSAVGYSKSGFKVVWSKNPNPTYPTRDSDKYVYLSDPMANNTVLEAFNGTGVYYVRVCEYLGNSCGVYSNEITVSL